MTVYRGTFVDTPESPFAGNHLRAETDAALVVQDGVVVARGPASSILAAHRDHDVVDLREGLVLPGLVDTHVHFPQVRAIGGLGLPLLDGLARAGTTTALVFGSHFAGAVDALFTEATRVGLRVTSGLVLSDRVLRDDLLTTPERAYLEGQELAAKWHGTG